MKSGLCSKYKNKAYLLYNYPNNIGLADVLSIQSDTNIKLSELIVAAPISLILLKLCRNLRDLLYIYHFLSLATGILFLYI